MWTDIGTDDALELLGPGTVDSRVRAFAVRQLARADDEVSHSVSLAMSIFSRVVANMLLPYICRVLQELIMYLLQLVQALKFENTPADPARVPPVRTSSSQHTLQSQDSGLADFLVSRGVQNQVLGIRLHWYLMVEMENKATAKTYGRVVYKYMSKLMEVSRKSPTVHQHI